MDDKEARLLQARQLLKKYQNKHNGDLSGTNHINGNESCSDIASQSSRASSVCDNVMVKMNSNYHQTNYNENQELNYLKKALDEKDKTYRDVVQKLQTLQTHYAELHTAYNLATQTLQSSTSPEFAEQITKLQGALSVAIEEKTSYQSELRAAAGKLSTLETENKTLKNQIRASTGSSNLHETEKKKLHEENDRLARQLKHATSELEKQRRESLILESKIRQINQDRNDYSSRLKYIFNEKEELEKAVAAMKHELQMKEIFIKQLTFNDSEQSQHERTNQETFMNLTSEKERLTNDVQTLSTKLEESQRQQAATREYYESCIGELNRKVSTIEDQLRQVQHEKADFESNNYQLQEKINFMLSQQAAASIPQQQSLTTGTEDVKRSQSAVALAQMSYNIDAVEMEALKNSLTAVQADYSRAVDRIRELELVLNEKEMIIENLEKQIIVEKAKFESLRNDAETQQTVQTDVHLLLEQLQNEKATVSRAIAQNIELKEQLGELQDKFVEVTNESAAREDQRSTALATIEKLQKQLDDMIEERNNPKKIERTESEVQTETMEKEEVMKEEKHQQTDHILHLQTESSPAAVNDGALHSESTQEPSEVAIDSTIEQSSKIVFTPPHSPSPLATSCSSSTSNSSLSAAQMSRDQIIKMLEDRLESVSKEKKEIQIANDRLQYFLTALESENESIGEYIALYQFQRSNMQKKNAEKDALIQQLSYERKAAQFQIAELQQILYKLFGQTPPALSTKDGSNSNGVNGFEADGKKTESDNPIVEKLNKILSELQHHHHSSVNSAVSNGTMPSSSVATAASTTTSTFADPKLHCTECTGPMLTL
jgi:chromosome segregation ATPase